MIDTTIITFGSKNNPMRDLVAYIRDNAYEEELQICMMETEWLDVADALEKQLPMKPKGDANCFMCPTCGFEYEMTPMRPRYCVDCGQVLDYADIPDWEDMDWDLEEEDEE